MHPRDDSLRKLAYPNHSMTIRMASVADHLPDITELEEQGQGFSAEDAAEEANARPIVWDPQPMVLDAECDTSFETSEEKEEKASRLRPLGQYDEGGRFHSFATTSSTSTGAGSQLGRLPQRAKTVHHALPPDVIDSEATQLLDEYEKIAAAAHVGWLKETMPWGSLALYKLTSRPCCHSFARHSPRSKSTPKRRCCSSHSPYHPMATATDPAARSIVSISPP